LGVRLPGRRWPKQKNQILLLFVVFASFFDISEAQFESLPIGLSS
jgi:hypothetical protein